MRDFRDAKSMAQTLRAALAAKHHKISVGESLELIAHTFGLADWNTLSAMITAAQAPLEQAAAPPPRPDPLIQRAFDRVGFSGELEASLHRAVTIARQRRQAAATLEHLLLALIDDPDGATLLLACNVQPEELRLAVAGFVAQADPSLAADQASLPSPAFQRVIERAVIHAQASNRVQITGANLLVAIFSERESQACHFLEAREMTRYDAVNFIARGIPKGAGGEAA